MGKKILIVGANFVNKGAQSMLFVSTDELKRRFPDCEVFFACNGETYKENNYTFKKILYTKQTQRIALDNKINWVEIATVTVKDIVKTFLGRRNGLWKLLDARKIMPTLDLIIDVSGYALADICSAKEHEYYLDNIRLARKYNIPIILMPQSFGPFLYSKENMYLVDEMKELLTIPQVIYAREKEGKELLEDVLHLANVKSSTDLVLQNKGISLSNVCTDSYNMELMELKTEHNVAIIPNYHCFEKGNAEHTFELYRVLIEHLLNAGKDVYVFRHASFDLEICKHIVDMFPDNEKVHFIEREFDCIEYDEFINKFEFVICSRYHGCVHAYKNYVPNIILGWAVKYQELAERVGQSRFIFDISARERDEEIVKSLDYMIEHYLDERKNIKNNVLQIQEENCFTILDEMNW